MLSIAEDGRTLQKDGRDFFYLADTCWSAFTNITDSEWEYYLSVRKSQGFNTLQINILPQWDASETDLDYQPFRIVDRRFDYSSVNEEYFYHARHMCERAKAQGFELALVVLWSNYVPDTWCCRFSERGMMPYEWIGPYVEQVHRTFSDLNPIYVISGDTDFTTETCISYYVKAADLLKHLAPENLFTTHLRGNYTFIPDELYGYLDFLFCQSGHNAADPALPYRLAEEMKGNYPGKPLINSEPCYEEMGYSGNSYGRWTRFDVRRAAWMSVLSGAGAGITYGAAGIYSWHRVDQAFDTSKGEWFAAPKSWGDALHFAGSWDYGFLRYFLDVHGIRDLTPHQEWLVKENREIRVAGSEEKFLIYLEHNIPFSLCRDLTGYQAYAFDLENRFVSPLVLEVTGEVTGIPMHRFDYDVVLLLEKMAAFF